MKKLLCLAAAICLLLAIGGCGGGENDNGNDTGAETSPEATQVSMVEVTPEVAEDGYIYVIFPENVLGGASAEDAIDLGDEETSKAISVYLEDYYANEDGTATFVFDSYGFEWYRSNMFEYGQLPLYTNSTAINRVVYEDEMLTQITVYVDKEKYISGDSYTRIIANLGVAVYAGQYQVLSGVHHEEWHTTITMVDEESGEILSENEFPSDDMYSASAY